tara:strand:- start:803 stop:2191 length:1389 start_codon:yes stop_codon:yes gene_type:complete
MKILNDVQSKLNETSVLDIVYPKRPSEISEVVQKSLRSGFKVCPAGTLHSMGGQQFASGGISISSSALSNIGPLNTDSKTVTVQSGAKWPQLVKWLKDQQVAYSKKLTIIQKQTGADELSLGGALSSNIHGRVLGRKPIIDDIEGFYITTPDGSRLFCNRKENTEIFSLAIGGYGLYGFVDSINLRLTDRYKVKRIVSENHIDDAIGVLEEHHSSGATFGDFQYLTDEKSRDYLYKGISSVYFPVSDDIPIPEDQIGLSIDEWKILYLLAHLDKTKAYLDYKTHYLQTNGQIYWSDLHQFSPYIPDAGDMINEKMGWDPYASLVLTELYIPRNKFSDFMRKARSNLIKTNGNVVYGTVRLIEKENESFLRWAKSDFACVIFNLLVEHSPSGIEIGQKQFQILIDCALEEGGSFYLTYHRWARKDQIESAYPEFSDFIQKKNQLDPMNIFSSEWYQYYLRMFT